MKTCIDMAADRGAFIDQSQSFNVFMAEPTISKMISMHFYGWKKGLKTGMYYLRTRPAADAIKFTVDVASLQTQDVSSKTQDASQIAAIKSASMDSKKRKQKSDDESAASCPYDPNNPKKKECLPCSS